MTRKQLIPYYSLLCNIYIEDVESLGNVMFAILGFEGKKKKLEFLTFRYIVDGPGEISKTDLYIDRSIRSTSRCPLSTAAHISNPT